MTYISPTAQDAACDAIRVLVDTNGPGTLEIGTATMVTVLGTFALSTEAFGASSGGTSTANSLPLEDTSADNSGVMAEYTFKDGDSSEQITGTVGIDSDYDFIMSSLTVTAGDTISLSSVTLYVPAE